VGVDTDCDPDDEVEDDDPDDDPEEDVPLDERELLDVPDAPVRPVVESDDRLDVGRTDTDAVIRSLDVADAPTWCASMPIRMPVVAAARAAVTVPRRRTTRIDRSRRSASWPRGSGRGLEFMPPCCWDRLRRP
jgi:hypothetical protein